MQRGRKCNLSALRIHYKCFKCKNRKTAFSHHSKMITEIGAEKLFCVSNTRQLRTWRQGIWKSFPKYRSTSNWHRESKQGRNWAWRFGGACPHCRYHTFWGCELPLYVFWHCLHSPSTHTQSTMMYFFGEHTCRNYQAIKYGIRASQIQKISYSVGPISNVEKLRIKVMKMGCCFGDCREIQELAAGAGWVGSWRQTSCSRSTPVPQNWGTYL